MAEQYKVRRESQTENNGKMKNEVKGTTSRCRQEQDEQAILKKGTKPRDNT